MPRGRCSRQGYADLLRLVIDEPGTCASLAQSFGMRTNRVGAILRVFREFGVAYPVAWQVSPNGRHATAVWGADADPAPHPFNKPAPHFKSSQRQDTRSFCQLVAALKSAPCSLEQIAADIDISERRASILMRHMLRIRLVYVEAWGASKQSGWKPSPIYRYGIDCKSKPRPASLTAIMAAKRAQLAEARARARARSQVEALRMVFMTAGMPASPRCETS